MSNTKNENTKVRQGRPSSASQRDKTCPKPGSRLTLAEYLFIWSTIYLLIQCVCVLARALSVCILCVRVYYVCRWKPEASLGCHSSFLGPRTDWQRAPEVCLFPSCQHWDRRCALPCLTVWALRTKMARVLQLICQMDHLSAYLFVCFFTYSGTISHRTQADLQLRFSCPCLSGARITAL